jgi:hypothetical protein
MHYPDQRYLSKLTVIRREVMLPEEATGIVTMQEGKRVDIKDTVAQGVAPSHHVIVDVVPGLRLRKRADAERFMLVEVGDAVDEVHPLAGKSPERGRRVFSPVKGIVAHIENGRVLIQQEPEVLDLEAGVRGRVTQVIPGRGVVIETTGAQLQGVWGNDRRAISVLRMEPDEGIENIYHDQLNMRFLGAIIITKRQLTPLTISIAEEQGFAGIIAPSLDYATRQLALQSQTPILITAGYGDIKMSRAVQNFLQEFEGQQATLDAYQPRGWSSRRPELIINIQGRKEDNPARPNVMLTLRTGMNVRITREPYLGQTGRVVDLPKSPILLDNGLRVSCAKVELTGGETVFVPLANVEVMGR